jgi:hypothetical protein
MTRRDLLTGVASLASAAAASAPDFSEVGKNFSRAVKETYFNAAAQHPLGVHAVKGMQQYMDFMCNGWTDGLHDFWEEGFTQVKPMFARLINAKTQRNRVYRQHYYRREHISQRNGPARAQRGHQRPALLLSVAITPVALEINNFAAGLKAMVPTLIGRVGHPARLR